MNKSYDLQRILREIPVLIDRAQRQIVNVMRHKDLQQADEETIRQVDQLTRALEYLCDVEEYNRIVVKSIFGMLSTMKEQKKEIKKLKGIEPSNNKLADFTDHNVTWEGDDIEICGN